MTLAHYAFRSRALCGVTGRSIWESGRVTQFGGMLIPSIMEALILSPAGSLQRRTSQASSEAAAAHTL
jgi:hypothetical protein